MAFWKTFPLSDLAKMDTCAASSSKGFLLEDDFDAFLTVIQAEILEHDTDFLDFRFLWLCKNPKTNSRL